GAAGCRGATGAGFLSLSCGSAPSRAQRMSSSGCGYASLMRIASPDPSSTEMLFERGLSEEVVAVTHECDWPPRASALPHLTRSVIPPGLAPAEIDRAVRETIGAGRPLYELDRERLAQLEPDLVVTQAVCEVCAVSYDDVV